MASDQPQPPDSRSAAIAQSAVAGANNAVAFSYRHRLVSAWFSRINGMLGLPVAVLSAVAGGAALTNYPLVAGAVSFLAAGLAAAYTFLKPSEEAQKHLASATDFDIWATKMGLLNQEIRFGYITDKEAFAQYKKLSDDWTTMIQKHPALPSWATRQEVR